MPEDDSRLLEVLSVLTSQLVTDTATDNDVVQALGRVCDAGVSLLDATAAGIMLVDPRGGIAVAAASDERARVVELLQTQLLQGPCVDSIVAAEVIEESNLQDAKGRWPEFTAAASEAGYRSVLAIPLLFDGRAVGGINLLYSSERTFSDHNRQLGTILGRLVVLHLVREDDSRRSDRLTERILGLLQDRVQIEHAIGLIVGTLSIPVGDSWELLDSAARERGLSLSEMARALTVGTAKPVDLTTDTSHL